MKKPVIVSAVRTAGGKFGGKLAGLEAPDLGALVVEEAVKRAGIPAEAVDELVFGCGWQAGLGPNVARISAVRGGLPHSTPAYTVNLRCGSSLKAAIIGVLTIKAGEADVLVVGGTESSSNVPYVLKEARWGQRMGDKMVYDVLHKDGFMCPLADMLMGNTAELLAGKYGISREEQDAFALESHLKALKAMEEGRFREEVLPVQVKAGKTAEVFDYEEIPRSNISIERIAKLPPVFKKEGTVTAGNSCALCDAASAIVMMSEEKAKDMGVKPMAAICGYATAGVDPKYMGIGPVEAVPIALKKAGMTLADIDLIELNEAFAAQYLAVEREMKWDRKKVNVHGGAIALGHPVGATGTKILTTLLYALKTYDKQIGLVSLCVGGGQGVAIIVERL
ncbi:MAG: thiolase family protein [Bacillota bacterium]|nr:thiolase family protein [Bacillota bacterium]MDD3851549.1 thiolase family protein [Bacillota bacterium]MDD4708165.1 thiolase family protein [Bacillota bacterium]